MTIVVGVSICFLPLFFRYEKVEGVVDRLGLSRKRERKLQFTHTKEKQHLQHEHERQTRKQEEHSFWVAQHNLSTTCRSVCSCPSWLVVVLSFLHPLQAQPPFSIIKMRDKTTTTTTTTLVPACECIQHTTTVLVAFFSSRETCLFVIVVCLIVPCLFLKDTGRLWTCSQPHTVQPRRRKATTTTTTTRRNKLVMGVCSLVFAVKKPVDPNKLPPSPAVFVAVLPSFCVYV